MPLRIVSPSSENIPQLEKALKSKTSHIADDAATKTDSDADAPREKTTSDKYEIRSKKNFLFWSVIVLLFMLAIGNLILTMTILAVLRLGQCMESMEIVPDESVVKFFGKIDLDHVYKKDGLLESFQDSPLAITSENGSVFVNLISRSGRTEPKLVVNSTGTTFQGFGSFEVRNPETGEAVFSTSAPAVHLAHSVNHINAKTVATRRITAPLDRNLLLKSDTKTRLRGAEGLRMDSEQVIWSADQDILLQSVNGSVVLSGKEGVYIDVKAMPIAGHVAPGAANATEQFKICVCMPQGKLFRIAVRSGRASCDHVNLQPAYNPCV